MSGWAIKVRCKWKSDLRTYTSRRSDRAGSLFTVNFVDAEGTDITAAVFDEVAIQKHPLFEQGGVYYVGNGARHLFLLRTESQWVRYLLTAFCFLGSARCGQVCT